MNALLMMKMCAAIKLNDCNLKFSNYTKVRWTRSTTNWFSPNDNLYGTAANYGTYGTDEQWGIKYDYMSYNQVLLTSNDLLLWLVSERTVIEAMSTGSTGYKDFNVLSSSQNIDSLSQEI